MTHEEKEKNELRLQAIREEETTREINERRNKYPTCGQCAKMEKSPLDKDGVFTCFHSESHRCFSVVEFDDPACALRVPISQPS